jgi:hypothetical protein
LDIFYLVASSQPLTFYIVQNHPDQEVIEDGRDGDFFQNMTGTKGQAIV